MRDFKIGQKVFYVEDGDVIGGIIKNISFGQLEIKIRKNDLFHELVDKNYVYLSKKEAFLKNKEYFKKEIKEHNTELKRLNKILKKIEIIIKNN